MHVAYRTPQLRGFAGSPGEVDARPWAAVVLAQGGEGPTEPVVTGVTVPTAATVYAGRSISITAVVEGTNVSQAVTWSIQSGDGSINSSSANPVKFTAPAAPGVTVLRATSVDDSDFYDEITVTTIAAPATDGNSLIHNPIRGIIRAIVRAITR